MEEINFIEEEQEEEEKDKGEREVSLIQKASVIFVAVVILFGSLGYAYYRRVQEQAEDEFIKNVTEVVEEEVVTKNMVMTDEVMPGDSVMVSEAYLEQAGFIVVHEDEDGAPGDVIGVSDYLGEGNIEDEEILLDRVVEGGEVLYVMLHEDDGDEEWSEEDGPIVGEDEKVITFIVTVQEEDIEEATEEADLED